MGALSGTVVALLLLLLLKLCAEERCAIKNKQVAFVLLSVIVHYSLMGVC